MEKKKRLLKFLKSRKFILLVLPLLVFSIVSLIFFVMGGSRKSETSEQSKSTGKGLNPELPAANLKEDKALSKLSFYEKAERDSAKRNEYLRNDPYYQQGELPDEQETGFQMYDPLPNQTRRQRLKSYKDPNEEKVYSKLAELNKHLNQPAQAKTNEQEYSGYQYTQRQFIRNKDVDRLEDLMLSMKHNGKSEDPEMQQLNSTLDKILDVQHPDRVRERIGNSTVTKNNKIKQAKAVDRKVTISLLQRRDTLRKEGLSKIKGRENTGFYGIDEVNDIQNQNAIAAAVHETQTLVSGSVVKLRLLQDIDIQGQVVPNGQFLYGLASLNKERLSIEINSVRYANTIYPVELKVYDLDGMEGLYIPGAISQDVANKSTEDAVHSIGLTTMDRSLPAQAVTVGINAAKSLLTKKVKLVRVTVKAGYQVLLKGNDENQ